MRELSLGLPRSGRSTFRAIITDGLCREDANGSIAGHFFGVHAHGGQCNVGNLKNNIRFLGTDFSKLSDRRYQGWFAGAGVAYGYSWILGRHWNIEAEIGAGWIYTRYDVFPCAACGTRLASCLSHNYFGPTKAAVNLVFVF